MTQHPFRFKIGFIGAGNMAEAICRSLITAMFYKPAQIAAFDPSEDRTRFFRDEFGAFICRDNLYLAEHSEHIILAVKPQQMAAVTEQIRPALGQDQLIISIAAGISTRFLETAIAKSVPIVRVMPNTPLMIGAGTAALCRGQFATDDHLEFARSLFASSGTTITTDESFMDAVTALSGSGPAYFFYLIEAMIQAGVELGFSPDQAATLVANTALGAAKMVISSHADPAELRRKVTSPGGTTEAAIRVLDHHNVKAVFVEAVQAAARRSRELGK